MRLHALACQCVYVCVLELELMVSSQGGGYWELNSSVGQEQKALLTTEPLLQSFLPFFFFLNKSLHKSSNPN